MIMLIYRFARSTWTSGLHTKRRYDFVGHCSDVFSLIGWLWQSLQMKGNEHNRKIYEARLPRGFVRPKDGVELDAFIKAKYIEKKVCVLSLTCSV